MTFLQLCQKLRQLADIPGTGPSTTTGQTGELKRVVDWVAQAWVEIQLKHEDWRFMRSSFSFAVSTNATYFTSTDAAITSFGRWDLNLNFPFVVWKTSEGASDESRMKLMDFANFRDVWMIGSHDANRPLFYAIDDSNYVRIGPTAAAGYSIKGYYYKAPTVLSADSDEPACPSAYHDAIVYKALEYYGQFERDDGVIADAMRDYKHWLGSLERAQLPPMAIDAPPLA